MRRLLALIVVVVVVATGVYLWRHRPADASAAIEAIDTKAIQTQLGNVGDRLRDTKTSTEVKAALELNRGLRPQPIDVSVHEGVVTLRGEVTSGELRSTAERLAGSVSDVKSVSNELRVNPAAPTADGSGRTLGENLDDRAVELQVKLAFSLNRDLKGTDLKVQSFRREVTLQGEVKDSAQHTLALETARDVPGVEKVIDQIRLRGEAGTSKTTAQTAGTDRIAAARQALKSNASLSSYALEVQQEGERIVLRGRVRTNAERDLAGALAREAVGASIENSVEVKSNTL